MKYNFKEDAKFTPYGLAGLGWVRWDLREVTGDTSDYEFGETLGDRVYSEEMNDVFGVIGVGAHYFLSKYFSLEGSVRFNYVFDHGMDMNGFDGNEYGIFEGRLGFNIHFQKIKDTDGDGIFDNVDHDIMNPEDFDGFEDEDGAPDPDNDNDGVLDVDDGEPNIAEDMDGFQDEDGVPDLDNDGDGLNDDVDKSPNIAEDFDGFEDEDGAPDLDNDKDGILDKNDKCPNEPETKNGYMDSDGCPDEKPVEKPKPLKFENINFRTGSDYITLESRAILDKVVKLLNENPQMKLEINGYTDNTGPRNINMDLSKYRAAAVKKYLVGKGISEYRLTTNGYGPDDPIATNNTEEGRAKNRRIEFIPVK
jgi:outer membrane protein OmpA-like peptidoglycan-associated protein